MKRQYISVVSIVVFLCLFVVSCSSPNASSTSRATPTAKSAPVKPTSDVTVAHVSPTPTVSINPATTPKKYRVRTVLKGVGRPDDMVFDQKGRVLFSDFYNGTVSRINADGTVSIILSGLAGPEGLVVLPNGTLIIAEQHNQRLLSLAPNATFPSVLRRLPGTPSTAPCKDGVDGIAYDATSNTLIIPNSPIGEVYRMSLDGKTLTVLAKGITRPVGAAVDAHGTVYVADECGGALWRIAPGRPPVRTGGFGMLDDVVLDQHGNVLVTDLDPGIHALIRMNLANGKREVLASQGLIEPQGLLIDARDDIFISDDYANVVEELIPIA
jgi:sugar lactone lactonase YvrE